MTTEWNRAKVEWITALLVALFVVGPAYAQQAGQATDPPTGGQEPKRAGSTSFLSVVDDAKQDDQPALPLTPPTPIDTQMRVIGKAVPYTGFGSPLRWGPFSIAGADFMGVEDWFDPGAGASTTQLGLGLLRTNLDFDVLIHRSHLVLQYSPQAVIQNDQITGTASSNNNLAFGFNFDITPRLTMFVKDQFTYNRTKQVFSDQILQIYQGAGGILSGDFLQNSGAYLDDTFSVAIGYKLTPRWTLTTEPLVRYIDLKNTTINFTATGLDTQEKVVFTYALSPRSNLSFGYNFQEGHTFVPTVTDTYYHGFDIYYSRQISPTFWLQAKAGGEVAFYPQPSTAPVFFTGGLALVKNISKAAFAFSFVREKNIQNYFTDQLSDRVDSSFTLPVSRRLLWSSGVGYYHEIGAQPHTQGKYGQTSLDFHLTRTLTSFANYTFRFQHAETLQLLTGTHNTVIFGLRWEPARLAGK